jgi:hypothetical protein
VIFIEVMPDERREIGKGRFGMRLRAAMLISCALLLGLSLYHLFGKARSYEIPGGFKGWLLVRWSDVSCPPLQREGLFFTISFGSSGRACTSSAMPTNLTYIRVEYVYDKGVRQVLRLNRHGKAGTQVWLIGYGLEDKTETIFVGDERELDHSGSPPAF